MTAGEAGKGKDTMLYHHVSPHMLQIYDFVASRSWVTIEEITNHVQVSPRTVRAIAGHLTELGIFERFQVFPGYRYRTAPPHTPEGKAFLDKMESSRTVFSANP